MKVWRWLVWGWAWHYHRVNPNGRLRFLWLGALVYPMKWTIGLHLAYVFETMGWALEVELPMLTLRASWALPDRR